MLALILFVLPAMCSAAVPAQVGRMDLGAPLGTLRVTPDGKRAVALLHSTGGLPGGLRVIDTTLPARPIPQGFLAHVPGRLALARDGQQALLVTQLEKEQFNTATRHQIVAVDLTNPDEPKELWRREVQARNVVLAEDASAYAASQPSTDKQDRWQTVIHWVNSGRPETVMEEDKYTASNMQFSDRATFLVYPRYGNQFRVFDLRSGEPILYEQGYSFHRRHACIPAILESGHIVVEDERAPRLGIYAPQPDMPRIATLAHDGSQHCQRLTVDATGGILLFGDYAGRLYRVDLRQLDRPAFNGFWQLPPATYPMAVAGAFLYTVGGQKARKCKSSGSTPPARRP